MNETIKLVTTKSDPERAEEIRKEIAEVSQPLLELMTKITAEGFALNLRFGPNAFKQIIIQEIAIGRQF